MKRLTLAEVNEQYGGKLPPDAMLRADDEAPANPAPRGVDAHWGTRGGRFTVLNAFVDFGMAAAALTGAETKTWLLLFRDTKPNGTARTGQVDITRRTGLSVRGVKIALRGLRAKGMVDVVRRGGVNVGPSVYRVRPVGPAT